MLIKISSNTCVQVSFGWLIIFLQVNSNGLISFQTDIPQFINTEFPLDYPIIAPFYSNVDTTGAGRISYYQTENPELLVRATENVHEAYLNFEDFQAIYLLIVTWEGKVYPIDGNMKLKSHKFLSNE